MYNCNQCSNRLCSHYIISENTTVTPINGVSTLLIDLPAGTYGNCQKYCIVVRTLPDDVTVNMPVAITIDGVATSVYPLICSKTGLQAVGCQVRGRSRIQVCVQTSATGGVFRALCGLSAYCPDVLASLPAPEVAPPTTPAVQNAVVPRSAASTTSTASATPKKTSTTKSSTVDTMTVNASNVTVNKEDK